MNICGWFCVALLSRYVSTQALLWSTLKRKGQKQYQSIFRNSSYILYFLYISLLEIPSRILY